VTRPRAADDFPWIRARIEELNPQTRSEKSGRSETRYMDSRSFGPARAALSPERDQKFESRLLQR
jgi:hypothetical protein